MKGFKAVLKAVLKGMDAAAIGVVGAACVDIFWEAAIDDNSADAMIFLGLALTLHVVWSLDAPFAVLAGGVLCTIWHANAIVWVGATYIERTLLRRLAEERSIRIRYMSIWILSPRCSGKKLGARASGVCENSRTADLLFCRCCSYY